MEAINQSLNAIEETPIKKKRLSEKKYPEEKLKKVTEAFQTKILNLSPGIPDSDISQNNNSEIINQLKEKFNTTMDKSIKMQILTILPESLTLEQIENEFGVSNFITRKAKKLVTEKGVMSSPDPKPGRTLDLATVALVKQFYEDDEVSRQMPGKKDFVSVKLDGKCTHVQKYLILSTLREVYELFKERYPEQKVGFSKFCELCPKHCVLPGSSGTHSVCICTIHQNTKLMMAQCKMPESTDGETPIKTYKDLNLCHHEKDFNVKAEWNFFASSHGKNACDGVGGTVKRLAALASLCMVYNEQIMTPRQLYDWAKDNITNISFLYSTKKDHETEAKILKSRFESAKIIKGTQQFHTYIPVNETRVLVKSYSFSEESRVEKVSFNDIDEEVDINDIVGFVTCQYSDKWWLGCVLGVEGDGVKISFLEPHGPAPSFKYPQFPDILVVHKSEVLTKVDPTTATGRVYHLTESETREANKNLLLKSPKNK